jgi:nicotinamidase/pyrazinamidase
MEDLVNDPKTALLVVDQQYDFQPGGALAVEKGDEIVAPIAELMRRFSQVILTQDSHPPHHISFASSFKGKKPFELLRMDEVEYGSVESAFSRETLMRYLKRAPFEHQVLWPDHCIRGTAGWKLDSRLPVEKAMLILQKGSNQICDSYSAFFENDGAPTGLTGYLRNRGINRLVIVGLAGDYCVHWTAKDAFREGMRVVYDESLTRFVNFPENRKDAVREDLKSRGAELRVLISAPL